MRWLLIRGLARQSAHWGGFPDRLRESALASDVLTPDIPGFGVRSGERASLTLESMTDRLREGSASVRSQPGAAWCVMGISLGGMIVMDWLHRYPGDFVGGVLINTSAASIASPWQRLHWDAAIQFPRLLMERDVALRERRILQMTSSLTGDALAEALQRHVAIEHTTPLHRMHVIAQLAAAARFVPPVTLASPLCVLASRSDALVDPINSERLARRYGAPLYVHPRAGHDLPLDAPAWVIDQVATWMADHGWR